MNYIKTKFFFHNPNNGLTAIRLFNIEHQIQFFTNEGLAIRIFWGRHTFHLGKW